MNILLITWNFPPKVGGLENVIYNIWKGLSRNYKVYTVTAYSKDKKESLEGVHRSPLAPMPFYMFYAFFKGVSILRRNNIDVIFAGSALTSCVAVILGKIFRKKVVTHVYGLDVIYPALAYQFLIRTFLPKNDAVISISQPAKDELIKRGTSAEKIFIIHPGIDAALFKKELDQAGLKDKFGLKDKIVILSVCRLAKRKGIADFINNSLLEIIKQAPEVVYAVVGDNPRESLVHKDNAMKEIKEAVKDKGLEGRVKLFGNVDQQTLVELYFLCDLFLLPIIPHKFDIEGFGVTFIEANAAGKPVIGTRIGGIPEAIEDGRSGILTEAGNFKELSEKIISLLNDSARMREMGNYGRVRALERFDWDTVIKDYLKLFETLA